MWIFPLFKAYVVPALDSFAEEYEIAQSKEDLYRQFQNKMVDQFQ